MQILKNIKAIQLTALLVVFSYCLAWTQPGLNSPYSRKGLGDIANPNYIAVQHMGGIGAAYNDSYHSNFVNPASIGFLRSTSFEAGIFAQRSQWEDNSIDNSFREWSGNLTYLSLAFPLSNPLNEVMDRKTPTDFWSMGISLTPYSSVGYELFTEREDDDVGLVRELYLGDGNTYRVMWTTAFRHKNLSVGVNLGYHFGKISIGSITAPADLNFNYDARLATDFSVNGFVWRLGAQYKYYLKPEAEMTTAGTRRSPTVTVGAYYNGNQSFTSRSNYVQIRENRQAGAVDTVQSIELNERSTGKLPGEFGFGLMYDDNVHWKVGVDFASGSWDDYEIGVRTKQGEILRSTNRFAFGAEYVPDPQSYNNFFKRVRYRAGFSTGQDPRTVGLDGNEQLTRTAISVGIGLPIVLRQDLSFINLGAEFGRFGTSELLESNYVRFSLGFTLNDNSWFYKRKFN